MATVGDIPALAYVRGDIAQVGGIDYFYGGSSWQLKTPNGSESITLSAQSSNTKTVTLPSGRFTTAPRIQLTLGDVGTQRFGCRIGSVSTTQLVINLFTADNSSVSTSAVVHWVAIG